MEEEQRAAEGKIQEQFLGKQRITGGSCFKSSSSGESEKQEKVQTALPKKVLLQS